MARKQVVEGRRECLPHRCLRQRWVGLLVVLVLVGSWCVVSPQTGMPAPPDDQIAETLRDMAVAISEMQKLHELWSAGRVDMNGVIVTFSAEQRTALLSRYVALKAQLADLYTQFP